MISTAQAVQKAQAAKHSCAGGHAPRVLLIISVLTLKFMLTQPVCHPKVHCLYCRRPCVYVPCKLAGCRLHRDRQTPHAAGFVYVCHVLRRSNRRDVLFQVVNMQLECSSRNIDTASQPQREEMGPARPRKEARSAQVSARYATAHCSRWLGTAGEVRNGSARQISHLPAHTPG